MYYKPRKDQSIVKDLLILLSMFLLANGISAQNSSNVWFVKAGANGDGKSMESPLGSIAKLEEDSRQSDLIVILASEEPLDGGIALKKGQILIGLPEAGINPILTNTSADRNDGNGIVLAGQNRIFNVRVENTHASGIIGHNVSNNRIERVEIFGSNQGAGVSELEIAIPVLGEFPHGGILFLSDDKGLSAVNHIVDSKIIDATAVGIGANAPEGAQGRLVIHDCRIEKGTALGRMDVGIVGTAEGLGAQLDLEIDKCIVSGRNSMGGRNILVMSARDGRAKALIERSTVGVSGQDGILAVATNIPSQVSLHIRESVVENAAQTNIEGTILNLPASDPARADETDISIRIENSTIQHAGFDSEFEEEEGLGNGNIWMGCSALAQQIDPKSKMPYAPGRYRLILQDCEVTGGANFGLGFGNVWPGMAPEQSSFEVLMQNNRVVDNGTSEIVIAAPEANIDARGNCWGKMGNLSKDKIRLLNTAQEAQLDASEPIKCEHQ